AAVLVEHPLPDRLPVVHADVGAVETEDHVRRIWLEQAGVHQDPGVALALACLPGAHAVNPVGAVPHEGELLDVNLTGRLAGGVALEAEWRLNRAGSPLGQPHELGDAVVDASHDSGVYWRTAHGTF